jgi:small subunit ribosomal protein S21
MRKNFDGPSGLAVAVHNNDVNKALRKLKKKIAEEGIIQELKKREYYESKGTRRRKEKEAAIRRHKRNIAKQKAQLGY